MCVDVVCHSLLYLIEESGNFHLGCSSFLFISSRHPLCMYLQEFGSQDCKDILEVILTVSHNVVEKKPVLQSASKNGERVRGIFQVPVISGWADRCISSCKCTNNGIGCGFGGLGDELLWSQFCSHVAARIILRMPSILSLQIVSSTLQNPR